MYVRELLVQYRLRTITPDLVGPDRLSEPKAAAILLHRLIGHEAVEVCGVVCLSTRRMVVAYHELTRGTIDSTIVQPRDVFRTALLTHAPAIIVAHNHPSGDVTPSPEDVSLTHRLAAAAQLIGIELVDHLIVSAEGHYYSFREAGLLTPQVCVFTK